MKRILAIDARPLARGSGGIQRYLREILPYLVHSTEFEIILYSDKPITNLSTNLLSQVTVREIGRSFISLISWFFFSSYWLYQDQASIYWSPRHHLPLRIPKNCKAVVTIHDFVWKTVPESMPIAQRLSEQILMPFAIKRADLIICVSKTTKSQLGTWYPLALRKSTVIRHGNTPEVTNAIESKPREIKGNYFLAVGTLEPRKNYSRLLQAFDDYVNEGGDQQLVIVGKRGWKFKEIDQTLKTLSNQERIRILNNINDAELSQLYHHTSGLISISLDEGYGLPPQEAIAYNVPVLLADIPVYRELYPHTVNWVNPLSIDGIRKKLHYFSKQPIPNSITPKTPNVSWKQTTRSIHEKFLAL